MNRNLIIILIGLIGILASCEKDGDTITMLATPKAPTIKTMPSLTLSRSSGANVLVFEGTPVDPGFTASANYYLEVCPTGNNFANVTRIFSGVSPENIQVKVSDLNQMLLKSFPADVATSADFRLRAVLVVDGGTGAPGTGTDLFEYSSAITTASLTLYGLPRLDLIGSGMDQKIVSPLGNGVFTSYVKLSADNPFTLLDPETGTTYGGGSGTLVVNGAAIPAANGWHILNADINLLTYSMDPYMIGLVGSATPNGWDTPDQKLDYNPATGTWSITVDLVDGEFKFRKNDGWSWNLGGTESSLVHNGANIPITAGNYTITLTILDDAGEIATFKIVKNN